MSKAKEYLNKSLIKFAAKYAPTNGCDNCWGDLHIGCTDQCIEEFRKAGNLAIELRTFVGEFFDIKSEESGMKYESLLKKYMKHVFDCESITFVEDGVYDLKDTCNDKEIKVLEEMNAWCKENIINLKNENSNSSRNNS